MHGIRVVKAALILSVIALCPGYSQGQSLNVDMVDDLVSIEASNVSLLAIADRLTEITGIPISYTEGNDQMITVNIFEEPLRSAVTKLVENNVFITKTVDGEEVIVEIVFLLPDNQSGGAEANLPTGEPTEAVIVEEETPQYEPDSEEQIQEQETTEVAPQPPTE